MFEYLEPVHWPLLTQQLTLIVVVVSNLVQNQLWLLQERGVECSYKQDKAQVDIVINLQGSVTCQQGLENTICTTSPRMIIGPTSLSICFAL